MSRASLRRVANGAIIGGALPFRRDVAPCERECQPLRTRVGEAREAAHRHRRLVDVGRAPHLRAAAAALEPPRPRARRVLLRRAPPRLAVHHEPGVEPPLDQLLDRRRVLTHARRGRATLAAGSVRCRALVCRLGLGSGGRVYRRCGGTDETRRRALRRARCCRVAGRSRALWRRRRRSRRGGGGWREGRSSHEDAADAEARFVFVGLRLGTAEDQTGRPPRLGHLLRLLSGLGCPDCPLLGLPGHLLGLDSCNLRLLGQFPAHLGVSDEHLKLKCHVNVRTRIVRHEHRGLHLVRLLGQPPTFQRGAHVRRYPLRGPPEWHLRRLGRQRSYLHALRCAESRLTVRAEQPTQRLHAQPLSLACGGAHHARGGSFRKSRLPQPLPTSIMLGHAWACKAWALGRHTNPV